MEGTTEPVVAVIGHPIAGNPTQFALETGFHHAGIDCRVLSVDLPAERAGDAIRGMRAMNFRGIWIAENLRSEVGQWLSKTMGEDTEVEPDQTGAQSDAIKGVGSTRPDALILAAESSDRTAWTQLDTRDSQYQSIAASFLKESDLADDAISRLGSSVEAIDFESFVRKNLPQGGILQVAADFLTPQESNFEVRLRQLAETVSKLIQRDDNGLQIMIVDMGQTWDHATLACWESVAAGLECRCVRRTELHAACLASLVARWFGTDVATEVFHDAIDEYTAV